MAASYSEVKAGLDEVAAIIREQRTIMLKAKTAAAAGSVVLGDLPARFADVIATVNAYGTSNAAEALAKADMAKLTAEFQALKVLTDQLAAITP